MCSSDLEVMTWEYGSHASTFGGNPVSCAAAVATMDLLEGRVAGVPNGSLVENARVVGEHLKQRLLQWRRNTPVVGDVRGLGLMIGIEYVKKDECHSPDADLRNAVVDECFKRGMLVLGCGPNTLRLAPPLTLSIEQADWAAECIAASTQAACAAGK